MTTKYLNANEARELLANGFVRSIEGGKTKLLLRKDVDEFMLLRLRQKLTEEEYSRVYELIGGEHD